jgi:hypothetical protein
MVEAETVLINSMERNFNIDCVDLDSHYRKLTQLYGIYMPPHNAPAREPGFKYMELKQKFPVSPEDELGVKKVQARLQIGMCYYECDVEYYITS